MKNASRTLSVAIMSGKGGVGKTNISLNLSYCLFNRLNPLLLMDCDLGLANLDVLLNLSLESNLQDLLRAEVAPADVIARVEEGGFDFLPAASGVPELFELDEDSQSMIMNKLMGHFTNYRYLILDLGAGINNTVMWFAAMTHLRFVVVTPEPTSLTDGYALIKVLKNRYNVSDFHIIVNRAESTAEARQTFERLAAACRKFLEIKIHMLGQVSEDPAVIESVRRQVPLMKQAPGCPAARDIQNLADILERMRNERPDLLGKLPVLKKLSQPASSALDDK